jgi:hypothetical protein
MMDVDFDFIGQNSATLMGVSFASMALVYSLFYNPSVPAAFKTTMHDVIFLTIAAVSFFAFAALACFLTIILANGKDFENSSKNKPPKNKRSKDKEQPLLWPSLLCTASYFAGLATFFWALMVIVGLRILINPFPI